MRKKIKIATVYISRPIREFQAVTMDTVRWLKISEALARLGYQVDMVTNEKKQKIIQMAPNLRRVPYSQINWSDYQVVKTLFPEGFRSLEKAGGSNHPFIISKTTVVGSKNEPGVHFETWTRWRLFQILKRINQKARFVTILSLPSKKLWEKEFGVKKNILLVPTGVDKIIPSPKKNPYKKFKEKIVLFAGNIRNWQQRRVNLRWQNKLNNLGHLLKKRGIRLCFIGSGSTDRLDLTKVTYLSPVENNQIWDYQYFADCGIVFAEGRLQNFEMSKIYYYLRTGLPVVSESPVPNNDLIKKTRLGFIAPYNNDAKMAELIEKAIYKKWNKKKAIDYILKHHTWDKRVEIYDKVIRKEFGKKYAE